MYRIGRALAALALVTTLTTGCGGGSGGGSASAPPEDNSTVEAFYQSPMRFIVFDDSLGTTACTSLSFNPFPENLASIQLEDSGGVFKAGPAGTTRLDLLSIDLCVAYDPAVAAGALAGTLTLKLCKDVACTSTRTLLNPILNYSGNVYHVVEGLPLLNATFQVDRVFASAAATGARGSVRTYTLDLKAGHRFEVDVGVPTVLFGWSTVPGVVRPDIWVEQSVEMVYGTAFTFFLPVGSNQGSGVLSGRVADGRTVEMTVNVTR